MPTKISKAEWQKTDYGKSAMQVHKLQKDATKKCKEIKSTMKKLELQLNGLSAMLYATGNFSRIAAGGK